MSIISLEWIHRKLRPGRGLGAPARMMGSAAARVGMLQGIFTETQWTLHSVALLYVYLDTLYIVECGV